MFSSGLVGGQVGVVGIWPGIGFWPVASYVLQAGVEPLQVIAKRCQGDGPVLGDAQLGAVLRALREGRDLTLTAVARRAGCVESTVSYVECGHRRLQPWLAQSSTGSTRQAG